MEISQVDPPLEVAINKKVPQGASEMEPASISEPIPNRQSVIEPTLTTNALHFYVPLPRLRRGQSSTTGGCTS